jgi:hypothetical protein
VKSFLWTVRGAPNCPQDLLDPEVLWTQQVCDLLFGVFFFAPFLLLNCVLRTFWEGLWTVWGAPDCPEGLVPGIGKIFVEKTIDLSLLCTFDGAPGCRENLFCLTLSFPIITCKIYLAI